MTKSRNSHRRATHDDLGIPTWPIGFERLQYLKPAGWRLAVDAAAPNSLKEALLVVATAFECQMTPTAARKKFGHRIQELVSARTPLELLVIEMSVLVIDIVEETAERIISIERKPDVPWLVAAGAALFRLQSTFRSALILTKLGYFFEVSACLRLIAEQLAWALAINGCDSPDVFRRTKPQSCISHLNQISPELSRLYGDLSENAHMQWGVLPRFTSFVENDVSVTTASLVESSVHGIHLLTFADALAVATEITYRTLLDDFRHIRVVDLKPQVLDSRPYVSASGAYAVRLGPILNADPQVGQDDEGR